ncbi:TPA: hypothetical protein U1157_001208 [Streptococcus suis]|uniref:hypothetical protein n=1 Tax=Streptococcus suis TaxID=1307 RepID=UPI0003F76C1D|nr:hypothetical protein [Streptococcus suis]HEL1668972.1 hypothetical protein [Streptococcus suis]HEL1754236.1 hypothetical protein [Streptococcus suis]HEM3220529.1 hypothetical protein [Streptococcus suis 2651]HEM4974324.1 hypothetical protein [Streptococcus suis]HEM5058354.1 hypothetical protein [Streptococcus suis]
MNKTIENVKITKTFLGREDHGILTCYLTVEGYGFGVSIGGYCLDKYDERKKKRVAFYKSFELIDRILEVVGVSTWEDLPGKHIRIESDGFGCRVMKIGNLIKDDWLDFDTFFKEETDGQKHN